MDEAEIERLAALEKKATPAPWVADTDGINTPYDDTVIGIRNTYEEAWLDAREDDLALAAEARNALPHLLAYVRTLQERVAELEETCRFAIKILTE